MIPKRFDNYALASFDEAIRLLGENEEAKVLAGGQSLLPMIKLRLAAPTALVDITKLPDLSYVRDEGNHLAIGALTTHDAIEHDGTIKETFTAINDAAVRIGDQQIRNRGTIVSLTFRITPRTWKVSLPPKYGAITLSPFVTGIPSRASVKYLSSMGGAASSGATTTFSAGAALTFFTMTASPMATPALFLMRPSILPIPRPSSEG